MNGRGSTPHELYHVHVYPVAPLRALRRVKGEACVGTELATRHVRAVIDRTRNAVTLFKLAISLVKAMTFGGLVSRFPERVTAFVAGSVPLLGAIAVVSVMKLLRLESYGPGLGGLTKEVEKQVPWSPRRCEPSGESPRRAGSGDLLSIGRRDAYSG